MPGGSGCCKPSPSKPLTRIRKTGCSPSCSLGSTGTNKPKRPANPNSNEPISKPPNRPSRKEPQTTNTALANQAKGSLADWPNQVRAVEVVDNGDGTLSLFGTMLDFTAESCMERRFRRLSVMDYVSGWEASHVGTALDRNVELVIIGKPRNESRTPQLIEQYGLKDIVTGKRFWAHGPAGDPEPNASPVLYWFGLRRNADKTVDWVPHLIDDLSGTGTQVMARDHNGDGLPDVLVGNKHGVHVFTHHAKTVTKAEWEAAQPKPLAR